MAEHDLVGNYLQAIQAFNDNDIAGYLEVVSTDVTYTVHGRNSLSGVYDGIDAFRRVLARAKESTTGTLNLEPVAVLSDDERHVMVWGRLTGTRDDLQLDAMHAWVYRFDADGRLVEGHSIPADQHVVNDFWG